ncbi:DUF192 domain-containing protein [Advenella sp. RU8]|mgnify:CR=1 FL=1|uniref:DUF192 domain-containing protein n=1 Tax=Advenella sp. RU8 TaxID=3399575 RepID=UPI003AACA3B8
MQRIKLMGQQCPIKSSFYIILVLCVFILCTSSSRAENTTPLKTHGLSINNIGITAEIADTPETRTTGLMYRKHLAADHGMLFVFEESQPLCFWMRNTYIPLSIAFLDAQGKILNIHEMLPLRDDNHCSAGPAKYALEMNRHWFTNHNVKEKDIIRFLPH